MSTSRVIQRLGQALSDLLCTSTSAGSGDAGKGVLLNSSGLIDSTMLSASGSSVGTYLIIQPASSSGGLSASTTYYADDITIQNFNQSSTYVTALKGGTIKSVEYITQGSVSSLPVTMAIYNVTTSATVTGTSTSITVGFNVGHTLITGLSATVSAGDKLQILVTNGSSTGAVSPLIARIYME